MIPLTPAAARPVVSIFYALLIIVLCHTPHGLGSIISDYRDDDGSGGQLPTFASTSASSASLAATVAVAETPTSSLSASNNIIIRQQQHHHHQQQQHHLKEWNVDSSADDIRCFCNMPKCITAGYMCRTARSRHGGCYWEQRASRDQSMRDTRHGCLELLKDEYTEPKCNQTLQRTAKNAATTTTTPSPLLHCCHEDMCNHVDRPERPDQLAGSGSSSSGGGGIGNNNNGGSSSGGGGSISHINRSRGAEFIAGDRTAAVGYADGQFGGIIAGGGGSPFEKQLMIELRDHGLVVGSPDAIVAGGAAHIGHNAAGGYGAANSGGGISFGGQSISNHGGGVVGSGGGRDGWFRTATIIFPIGGAVILFVLIALAVRILRSDNADMMDYHHPHHHASKPSAMAAARSVASTTLQLGGGGGGGGKAPTDCDLVSSAYMINMQQHQQQQQPVSAAAMMAANGSALLLHNNYRKASGLGSPALIANDLRNVAHPVTAAPTTALSKKNHLKAFEYTLLPQRCCLDGQTSSLSSTSSSSSSSSSSSYSPSPTPSKHKATNATAAAAAAVVGSTNVNLSSNNNNGQRRASTASNGAAYDTKGCKVYQKETLCAASTPYWNTAGTSPMAK